MRSMKFKKKWILITGASSGLGEEMAKQLAQKHKANLILVARRTEKLDDLKSKLESTYGVQCMTISADLSKPEDVQRVFDESTRAHKVHGAIMNAGITQFAEHVTTDWETIDRLINLNVKSVMHLTHLFAPYMLKQKTKGGIMFVASMAGLLPVPYQAAYSGSKAFITNFGMSFSQELSGKPLSLTVYAPGGIDTEMTRNSDLDYFSGSSFIQSVEECAADAIGAMKSRKMLYVPGKLNQLQVFGARFAPRKLLTTITGTAYKHALKEMDKAKG